jgi:lipoprotein-releasing system permease protein
VIGERGSLDAPLPLVVARRYLASARKDAFVRFLAGTATAGIALGAAALVLALALLAGFQAELKGEILARTPLLEIEPPAAADAEAALAAVTSIVAPARVLRVVSGPGWVVGEGRVRPVELSGYEGELPPTYPQASDRRPGVYVGSRLAEAWGLAPGGTVELASNRPAMTPFGLQPRSRRLPLTGTFASGRVGDIDVIALPLAEAVGLLGERHLRLEVALDDPARAAGLAARLEAALPEGTRVRTWQDLNRGLLFALRLEKAVTFVAVFLIVVVAGLSLVCGLLLLLSSKRREVAMLGAMGASSSAVRRAFLLLAALLAGRGLVAGAAAGALLAWTLDRFALIRLPEQVYFVSHVPFRVEPADVASVLAASAAVVMACAALVAHRAAGLRPSEGLRR